MVSITLNIEAVRILISSITIQNGAAANMPFWGEKSTRCKFLDTRRRQSHEGNNVDSRLVQPLTLS